MTEEFEEGDVAQCPHCGKEYKLDNLSEDDYDDFDQYFEHVTTCD